MEKNKIDDCVTQSDLKQALGDMGYRYKGNGQGADKISAVEASQNEEIIKLMNNFTHLQDEFKEYKKIQEFKSTSVSKDLRNNLLGIVSAIVLAAAAWGTNASDVQHLRDDVDSNTTFVSEWPREGELPSDVNQNTKIEYLEFEVKEQKLYNDKLYTRISNLEQSNQTEHHELGRDITERLGNLSNWAERTFVKKPE